MKSLIWFAACLLLSGTAVTTAWLISGATWTTLPELDPAPSEVLVHAEPSTTSPGQRVSIKVSSSPRSEVLSWAESGVVTAIHINEGAAVAAGQRVFDVDHSAVLGYTGQPFHRDLDLAATGPDVVALRQLLRSAGSTVAANGAFDEALKQATKKWQTANAIQPADGVFRRSSLVLLPQAGSATGIQLKLGAPVPQAGAAVFSIGTNTRVLTLPEADVPPGEYTLAVAGARSPVTLDEAGQYTAAELDRLLTKLEAHEDGSFTGNGQLKPTTETPVLLIPGAALITAPAEKTCVALPGGQLTNVTVVGTDTEGRAMIEPSLPDGARVVANPLAAHPGARCP
ncbi:peptidoglycan-binding protein [Tessaracoccus sp. OH4464_COT-324]|uniref:peptidoglycan-binding protein n=1 Tax=Tessaracoccus sp. OH4464_COT-324 TaxID=2491059 RepID=UPI001319E952|nr:peptidoglycan-binding protein [Tessaracoccus sp. OH4464_COT-324]